MNREVHVRFWESAGLRCPALLAYLNAHENVAEAKAGIGAWLSFYNAHRNTHLSMSLKKRGFVARDAIPWGVSGSAARVP